MPEGTLVYAIGDVHGRADCLESAFERMDSDPLRADANCCVEVYLGDYADRGPATSTVISMLVERCRRDGVVALRGNHEAVFLEALADPLALPSWGRLGGLETIQSYGVDVALPLSPDRSEAIMTAFREALPSEHIAFLSGLPLSESEGDYFFVHAGIQPGVPLAEQRDEDMLWIRDAFLDSSRWHGKMIVHGHTPVERPEVLPNRINIDTGAYVTGNLTCLRINGTEQAFI